MSVKESAWYPAVFTFIYAFIFIFLLSLVNLFTSERVEQNQELFEQKAVLQAFDIPFGGDSEVFALFSENVTVSDKWKERRYIVKSDNRQNYGIRISGSGLWGTITAVVTLAGDGQNIKGLSIISHSETPGLGGRIEEAWFAEQFRGERIGEGFKITFVTTGKPNTNSEDSIIDGITGATRTTDSMETIVNEALKLLQKTYKEGVGE